MTETDDIIELHLRSAERLAVLYETNDAIYRLIDAIRELKVYAETRSEPCLCEMGTCPCCDDD